MNLSCTITFTHLILDVVKGEKLEVSDWTTAPVDVDEHEDDESDDE